MQVESVRRLVLTEEARRLELRERELEVLVQVVDRAQKLAEVSRQHLEDAVIPVQTCNTKGLVIAVTTSFGVSNEAKSKGQGNPTLNR